MLDLDDTFIVNPTVRWFKIIDSLIFQKSRALVRSKLMEVEIGLKYVRATNRFNEMLFLETDRTESKTWLVKVNSNAQKYNTFLQVLLDELKDWEKKLKSRKRRKPSNKMYWR